MAKIKEPSTVPAIGIESATVKNTDNRVLGG